MTALEASPPTQQHTPRNTWWFPVLMFFVVAAVLAIVVQVSHEHMKLDGPESQGDPSNHDYFGGWMQFDTGWYLSIAEHGYDKTQVDAFDAGEQSAVAYFPAYPLTVRQTALLTGDDFVLAAHLTTIACGLAIFLLFWAWCGRRLSPAARRVALLLLALYPYSWFLYGSGYGDVLFIAVTIGVFLLLERDRPVLAGLAGAGASATRLIGIGTIIGLIALVIERRHALVRTEADGPRRPWSGWRLDRSRLRLKDGGVLLSFAGVGSYCLYLWSRVGDPIAFNDRAVRVRMEPGDRPQDLDQVLVLCPGAPRRAVLRHPTGRAGAVVPAVRRRHPLRVEAHRRGLRDLHGGDPRHSSDRVEHDARLRSVHVERLSGVRARGALLADRAGPRRAVLVCSGALLFVLASFFGRGFYLS